MSVGMAIAGRWLASRYNRESYPLFDFDVYALAGDGCMMEGISSEAASLAGHLGLSKLCWIYDSNRVTIEGHTDITFTEDVAARFLAYGWNVTTVADANDLGAVARAFGTFRAEKERPTLILVHSHIGYGSPVEDSPKAHGEPFGVDGVRATKTFLGLPEDRDFYVPDGVYDWFAQGIGARGSSARKAWESLMDWYRLAHPELADEIDRMQRRELPDGWEAHLEGFPADDKGLASRDSSGQLLNEVAEAVPWLVGGSADLTPSTKTRITLEGAGDFEPDDPAGRNLHYGIREHASAAISNGMSLVKVRPYWSGFLIFSDYARGAIRLSALMELPVIHIFTHDSIGVGEDGPTHQPVEQLASLRATPGLLVFRPCDANEVVETWRVVMRLRRDPAVLVLSRQALPTLDRVDLRVRLRRCAVAATCSRTRPTARRTSSWWPPAPRCPWRSPPERSSPARASAPGSSPCRAGSSSIANRPNTANEVLPLPSGPGWRWSRRPPWAGSVTWAATAPSSACTPSVRRPR